MGNEIKIATGLVPDPNIYTFEVQANGTRNYVGKSTVIEPQTLTINNRIVTGNLFTIENRKDRVEYDHPEFDYGIIKPIHPDLRIINATVFFANIPASIVDPRNNLTIRVNPPGMGVGTKTFSISVRIDNSGYYDYASSVVGTRVRLNNLLVIIFRKPIDLAENVEITQSQTTADFGYSDFTYGTVALSGRGISGNRKIVNVSPARAADKIIISGDEIKVASGIGIGDYTFQVEATGTGNYTGTVTSPALSLTVAPG